MTLEAGPYTIKELPPASRTAEAWVQQYSQGRQAWGPWYGTGDMKHLRG
jgi:hypothetical protein